MTNLTAAAGAVALLFCAPFQASATTLTFDEFAQDDGQQCYDRNGLSYCEPNKYVYGLLVPYATLSDYDWDPYFAIYSSNYFSFSPVSMDLVAGNTARLYDYCLTCNGYSVDDLFYGTPDEVVQADTAWSAYDYDFIHIVGYRTDGTTVEDVFGAASDFSGLYTFKPEFNHLWSLEIYLTGSMQYSGLDFGGSFASCEYSWMGCLDGSVDNLSLISDVPLPAAGLLGVAALGSLGVIGRRRRRGSVTAGPSAS